MKNLTKEQIEQFNRDGFLVVENAIDPELLQQMKDDFNNWVDESRKFENPYGETVDGRPRFDLETGHNAAQPGLRRVNAPVEVSKAYYDAMINSNVGNYVADLVGANVKFHHSKINSKLPKTKTVVKWHQDFPFTPHTNDDLITCLFMVDDVTEENGPLEVVAGSHKKEIHTLWHDGVFTGAVKDDVTADCIKKSVICTGKAGSVALMHTRTLHGSAPNNSDKPRTLFICVYSAEDAIPVSPNPVPTEYEGLIVRGQKTNKIRSVDYEMDMPQKPKSASFFDQQAKHKENAA
ncbi:phytanoyl-CoA dioxygenase family protein [Curvivirga aplysinae]|uniref:phytanoyl-CoA dioxygenase family protein n=1 Tax=Curvivirga aplysinae TaxID=2529852 RepID=UPI0012BC20D7|nr:phytanoyl-CoA dioxygenase family protein [Curvivirga aplysinae]MTI11323.1 phytanoyl-CoA dioxygenase family protein [Curvivirga aplysinae]